MTARFDFSAPVHGHARLESAWLRNAHGAMLDLLHHLALAGDPAQVLMRKSPPAVGLLHSSLVLWCEQTSIGPECGIQYRRRGRMRFRTMFASLALLSVPEALAARILTDLRLNEPLPMLDLQALSVSNPGDI